MEMQREKCTGRLKESKCSAPNFLQLDRRQCRLSIFSRHVKSQTSRLTEKRTLPQSCPVDVPWRAPWNVVLHQRLVKRRKCPNEIGDYDRMIEKNVLDKY